jgi:hypothetical protein
MTIRKYEFPTLADFLTKAASILPEDIQTAEAFNSATSPIGGNGCTIVKLVVETTPATFDAEGNVLTPAVLSPKFHVDISYNSDAPAELVANEVWPASVGVHIFSGWKEWYEAEYQKRK